MLKKFIIERDAPGIGSSTAEQIQQMAIKSNDVLAKLGPKILWRESFLTDDKLYCVYMAESKDLVKEHARLGGFPADKISEVKMVMDPTTEGVGKSQLKSKENASQIHA